jgi:hypothetical protein
MDFSNFDETTLILFGLLALAMLAYYFWPEVSRAQAEVKMDGQTRKKAQPMIALASDEVKEQIFELQPMPLRIVTGEKLKADSTLDRNVVRDALWVQQRALITRLESELDYAQQADISEHFALAAPANQPGELLQKTLKGLENALAQIRLLLKLEPERPLWHGRAMILMLSTRKLFDHVAWLTGAGLAASAPGAFVLSDDGVVMITIYATRVELGILDRDANEEQGGMAVRGQNIAQLGDKPAAYMRPMTLQVSRAVVLAVGGARTPKWVEYGLAHWMAEQIAGKTKLRKDEKPPTWCDEAAVIFDAREWDKAGDDTARLEQLVAWSSVHVGTLMSKSAGQLLGVLNGLRGGTESDAVKTLRPMQAEATAKAGA